MTKPTVAHRNTKAPKKGDSRLVTPCDL